MKALIVSDSHGMTEELAQLKQQYATEVNIMIHCGDSELSANQKEIDKYEVVRGNCDFDKSFPLDIVTEVEGVRFFITHGHRYNVKITLQNLLYRAREHDVHIACFGHSHIIGAEFVDGILLINPGSLALPRMRKEKTYVLLEMNKDKAIVIFRDMEGTEVEKLIFSFND